jgi:hypothetical protein
MSPAHDKLRIQILGQSLKGKALKHFTNEAEMAQHAMRTLDFKEMILSLQDRYYRNAMVLVAANKFERLTQGTRDVQGLADELRLQANRMAEMPSDYTIRRRFIQALKPEISKWILRNGRNPENLHLAELIEAARNYKDTEEYEHTMQGSTASRLLITKKVATPSSAHNRVNSNKIKMTTGRPTF